MFSGVVQPNLKRRDNEEGFIFIGKYEIQHFLQVVRCLTYLTICDKRGGGVQDFKKGGSSNVKLFGLSHFIYSGVERIIEGEIMILE